METIKIKNYGYINQKKAIPGVSVIRSELIELFNYSSHLSGAKSNIKTDEDIIKMYHENNDAWVMAYQKLRYLPSVYALINHSLVAAALKEYGIQKPIIAAKLVLRADIPHDKDWNFAPHQDYSYNLGSKNCVTIWIPFQDVAEEDGALKIKPNSQKAGVYKHKDGFIEDEKVFANMISHPMKAGEVLCFSQFLVHSSGENTSNKVRFSLQIRYSDLEDQYFINTGWKLNEGNEPVSFDELDPLIRHGGVLKVNEL
jgi:ectoine hydroxylase-related dioxygenase (phytanoyl-CoA dioxygenase family)